MPPERPAPIVSTRADDPDLEERIDGFVVQLGETVDHLQDAEAEGDTARLVKLASELATTADTLGYPPLAEAAARVREACAERLPEAVHKRVAELTEVSQRVRRGHRSCA